MTVTFTTQDPEEARRLAKATDMASFIFDLVYNVRQENHEDTEALWARVDQLLVDNAIAIEDLIH